MRLRFPSFAKKPKYAGDPIDYLDYDFFQVIRGQKGKVWIVDFGYFYEISPGMYGGVQYANLWLDPVRIRREGWEYYESEQAPRTRKVKDLTEKDLASILSNILPDAKPLRMSEVNGDTGPGWYYMLVSDMREQAFAKAAEMYESYGYSDEADEDTLSYLDDVRMDEVTNTSTYKMNGKYANKLMAEKMWEDQKTYGDYDIKEDFRSTEVAIRKWLYAHKLDDNGYDGIHDTTEQGIAEGLGITQQRVSVVLNQMEKKGDVAHSTLHVANRPARVKCYYLI